MGAQIRVYRQKIASTSSMKKIFKAMELIATSRVGKARVRAQAATPYAEAITRAVSAVASHQGEVEHVLTEKVAEPKRAAVLIMTSDRGLAGAYSVNALKQSEALVARLQGQGVEVRPYLYGRKAKAFYDFRNREYDEVWTGSTEAPDSDQAREISRTLVDRFVQPVEEGGVDELYLVYTQFKSMMTQEPTARRLLPLAVVEDEDAEHEPTPLYDFETSAEEVLDALLPRYIESRIFTAMLEASASELAARQKAMKSAADNADELIRKYTLLRNNARQAEITQELTELIAGADALAS